MVIEYLKFRVSPELREKFIQEDAEIWTPVLARAPGFISKEVWISPQEQTEVALVIRWKSREHWQAVPKTMLDQTEQDFSQQMAGAYELIETSEYQVRKFS